MINLHFHWSVILIVIIAIVGFTLAYRQYHHKNKSSIGAPFFAFFALIIGIITVLLILVIGGIFLW